MNLSDILALIGVTIILTWGSIFEKVRTFYPKFLDCALCVGFWIGLGGSVLRSTGSPIDHFLHATTVSLLSFAASVSLELVSFATLRARQLTEAAPPPVLSLSIPDPKELEMLNEALDTSIHSRLPPQSQSAIEAGRQLAKDSLSD